MSQENVDALKRALDAGNRRDIDALLEEIHPEVEWHPALAVTLGGEAVVYRGHEGARRAVQELFDAFAEFHFEVSEIRDPGDQVVAIGRVRARGADADVELESPWAWVARVKDGKATWVRSYLDPNEALEAAGLRE